MRGDHRSSPTPWEPSHKLKSKCGSGNSTETWASALLAGGSTYRGSEADGRGDGEHERADEDGDGKVQEVRQRKRDRAGDDGQARLERDVVEPADDDQSQDETLLE